MVVAMDARGALLHRLWCLYELWCFNKSPGPGMITIAMPGIEFGQLEWMCGFMDISKVGNGCV